MTTREQWRAGYMLAYQTLRTENLSRGQFGWVLSRVGRELTVILTDSDATNDALVMDKGFIKGIIEALLEDMPDY